MRFLSASVLIIILCGAFLPSCGGNNQTNPSPTYTMTYDGNGNTGGTVPMDSNVYVQGQNVTVLANTGNLIKTSHIFSGWNTQANGVGTTYTQGQTFTMGSADVTLYAMWTASPPYTVTYDGNGNTGGTVPMDSNAYVQGQNVTVLTNTGNLVKTGYVFSGWNTQANGLGTTFTQAQAFTIGATNVILYAKWIAVIGYAYVANSADGSISQYTISADGSLTSMITATVWAGGWMNPDCITVDPSGHYVYAATQNNVVLQYTIGANGALIPMTSPIVAAGQGPTFVTVDPFGKYVYVTNQGEDTVSQYTIGIDGTLTSMPTPTVATGSWPQAIKVDPSGKYAYVANLVSNNISQYTIGEDGALTPMATPTVAAGDAGSITVDPSGRYVYAANINGWTISQYTIGANGDLTPMTSPSVGTGWASIPCFLTVDPSGKYVYVANPYYNAVSQFVIGAAGELTRTPTSSYVVYTGNSPYSITIDSTGMYAYTTNFADNTVSQFNIGTNGLLSPMTPATVSTGAGPQSIVTVRRNH
jgi:6-phosphogluconolactonase